MNIQSLKKFILDSNKHTYSTGNESLNKKEKDGSTTLTYTKGDWKIHDNFFGGEPYGGREVVFYKDKPVWMMVYYGTVKKGVSPEVIYPILQKALRLMPKDSPFRGPTTMKERTYTYKNEWEGTIEAFSGIETISIDKVILYTAQYVGGFVDVKKV